MTGVLATPGETDLDTLIASMELQLDPATYVFVTTKAMPDTAALKPIMMFQEAEGTTFILRQDAAQREGLEGIFPCRRITLNVHSSLEAVGFIARIATELAQAGMGVNPVAGFFHDHLFIAEDRADEAMTILQTLRNKP